MALFHNRPYFLSFLALAGVLVVASLLRLLAPPFPEKGYFKAAAAVMALALLGPTAAGFSRSSNGKVLAVIDDAAFNFHNLNLKDHYLLTITMPARIDGKSSLHRIDLHTGEVTPIPLELSKQWLDCFLSPDQSKIICSEYDSSSDQEVIWIGSTDDFLLSPIKLDSSPGFLLLAGWRWDIWSPDNSKIILASPAQCNKEAGGYCSESKYFIYEISSGKSRLITQKRRFSFIRWIDEKNLLFRLYDKPEPSRYFFISLNLETGEKKTLLELSSNEMKKTYIDAKDQVMLIQKDDGGLFVLDLADMRQYPLSFTLPDLDDSERGRLLRRPHDNLWLIIKRDSRYLSRVVRIQFKEDKIRTYEFPPGQDILGLKISPDGNKAAYLRTSDEMYIDAYLGAYLTVRDLDTDRITRLDDVDAMVLLDGDIDWSEDSTTLYYTEPFIPSFYYRHIRKLRVMTIIVDQ